MDTSRLDHHSFSPPATPGLPEVGRDPRLHYSPGRKSSTRPSVPLGAPHARQMSRVGADARESPREGRSTPEVSPSITVEVNGLFLLSGSPYDRPPSECTVRVLSRLHTGVPTTSTFPKDER